MRVSEEPLCICLFRQIQVFASLHLRSPVHIVPPQYIYLFLYFWNLFNLKWFYIKKRGKALKGQCHKILDFWFFYESVSPKPLSIPLAQFRIFSKIRRNIRSSRCTTCVVDTGGKWKKSSIIKALIILFRYLWEVELTYWYIFAFKFKVSAAW